MIICMNWQLFSDWNEWVIFINEQNLDIKWVINAQSQLLIQSQFITPCPVTKINPPTSWPTPSGQTLISNKNSSNQLAPTLRKTTHSPSASSPKSPPIIRKPSNPENSPKKSNLLSTWPPHNYPHLKMNKSSQNRRSKVKGWENKRKQRQRQKSESLPNPKR